MSNAPERIEAGYPRASGKSNGWQFEDADPLAERVEFLRNRAAEPAPVPPLASVSYQPSRWVIAGLVAAMVFFVSVFVGTAWVLAGALLHLFL